MATAIPKKAPVKKPASSVSRTPARAAEPVRTITAKPGTPPKATVAKAPAKTAVPAAKPTARPVTAIKEKKARLVRDSFTMPELEYAALGEVKKACLKAGFEVKKSELLRIGVAFIRKMELSALKSAVGALAPLKPGRPRKDGE